MRTAGESTPRHLNSQFGLAAVRARGRKGGRPTVRTPEKLQTARTMYNSRNYDVAAIGRVLGVSRASVYRALADGNASTVTPVLLPTVNPQDLSGDGVYIPDAIGIRDTLDCGPVPLDPVIGNPSIEVVPAVPDAPSRFQL